MNFPAMHANHSAWTQRFTSAWAAAAVLAVFWCVLLFSLRGTCLTFDEGGHAMAGASFWKFNDYRLNPENGNLPQRVMGLGILSGGSTFPSTSSDEWRNADNFTLAHTWFYHLGNDADAMAWRGRAAISIFAVALGALVWLWSRHLFGPVGGMLSLLLYALNPTVLANGALMTSDMACAFFFLAASGGCAWVVRRITITRVLLSALATAGLFVSKMSAVLIIPIALVLIVARVVNGAPLAVEIGRWRRELARRGTQTMAFLAVALAHVVVTWIVIWACCGFRFAAFAPGQPGDTWVMNTWDFVLARPPPETLSATPPLETVPGLIEWARRSRLLPEAYLYGHAHAWRYSGARGAFLNGEFGVTGWKTFFPYTFLVKTPLPVFAIAGLALAGAIVGWRARRRDPGATLPLWLLVAFYWTIVIFSHLNIGHRHILPTYAPLFVLCGAAAFWLQRSRAWTAVLGVLVVLLALEVGWRFPHYIAYFNGIVAPQQAYRHLVDSSLDWGQDLPGVRHAIDEGKFPGPHYLSYSGTASPAYYKIAAVILPSRPDIERVPPMQIFDVPADKRNEVIETFLREHPDYDKEMVGWAQHGDATTVTFLKNPDALRLHAGTYFISATSLQPVTSPTGPWGPWNSRFEDAYQDLRHVVDLLVRGDLAARRQALQQLPSPEWQTGLNDFEQLRFHRLLAFLRQREPDDNIGFSILVYRLTEADVARALEGPPPELGPDLPTKFFGKPQ